MSDARTFRPHPIFPGGHLQTLAGFYWPAKLPAYQAEMTRIPVPDGDQIALHDDCPDGWQPSRPVALLLHGLAGCHQSGYMVRLADRLTLQGIRTFRMDMRGSGASAGFAKLPGHAGRTEDAQAAIEYIASRCPASPLTLVGFSMGGNIALGTAANAAKTKMGNLQKCIAVCPPVNLSKCCRELQQGTGRFYDRYLLRFLIEDWQESGGTVTESTPQSIYEFDDLVTAPRSGYQDAEDYYAHCSSGPRLAEIDIPTKILAAKNDPIVPFAAIAQSERSPCVELISTSSGGHLGYVTRKRNVSDGRWMDWQLANWISE